MSSDHPGPRYGPLLELLRTADNLWNVSRQLFDRWDLSPSQFNILNLLRGSAEGLTQVELSRALIMHRSNVTGLIDRLEKRKLVARQANPNDRRAWRVRLTAAGEQLIGKILPEYHRLAEEVWGGIPVRRAEQMAQDLRLLSERAQHLVGELS